MPKILITWEMGGGLGHVGRLRPLIQAMSNRNWQVTVVSRDVPLCQKFFSQPGLSILQAPVLPSSTDKAHVLYTYADILYGSGYSAPAHLWAITRSWRNLYELIEPDYLLLDHSPTALLAGRDYPALKAVIGTGFICPPGISPLPVLREPPASRSQDVLETESRVLEHLNQVADALSVRPFASVADFCTSADQQFLLTFPELDHYEQRAQANYLKPTSSLGGQLPEWPPSENPRVFVYLKGHPTVPAVLSALTSAPYSMIVYAPWMPVALEKQLSRPNFCVQRTPLDMRLVTQQCQAAILNGGHGTTCEFLLAGKPLLVLPVTLEQQITAQRVAQLGAGLKASLRQAEQAPLAVKRLLAEPCFCQAAQQFAARYAEQSEADTVAHIMANVQLAITRQRR